jgi:hypothetical protein
MFNMSKDRLYGMVESELIHLASSVLGVPSVKDLTKAQLIAKIISTAVSVEGS